VAIYKPKGRAAEYCEIAVNPYQGCSHGCIYCYVPRMPGRNRENFHKKDIPKKYILQAIETDLERGNYEGKHILLCFTCDPYQKSELGFQVTRETLKLFKRFGVIPVILTKGGIALRDIDLLKRAKAWYGATLTIDNEADSLRWEPRAALPEIRINNLIAMHEYGIKTWVSLEPVIYPAQTLELIDRTHKFIDMYKVGKMNHHRINPTPDWGKFAREVVKKLKFYNKQYYIKKDLGKYLVK